MKTKRILALLLSMLLILSIVQPCIAVAAAPSVELEMSESIVKGSGERAECTIDGLTDPVYTWTSDNTDVAEVVGYGKTAFVKYKTEGTATVTVSVTGNEGTLTDSATVTVTGDIPNPWDEVIPADEWTYYQLVDAPSDGKDYLILSSNKAGSCTAMSKTMNKEKFSVGSGTISAATEKSDNKPYIDGNVYSEYVWRCSVASNGNYLFSNNGNYISAKKDNQFQLSTNSGLVSQWTYTNNKIKNASYTNSGFKGGDNEVSLSKNAGEATNFYFYEKTDHVVEGETIHHDDVIPAPYEPTSTLKYNNADADGKRFDIYNTPIGTEIMLDGSYTGYASNGALTNAVWSSSNADVATVQNGVVTVTGTGLTEITYTVTDGTTTLVKKVLLNISQKDRPTETYVLTDTLTAGKQYAIVTTNTAGDGAAMTADLLNFSSGYCRIAHDDDTVTVEYDGSETSFTSDNEKIIFTAEADAEGNIYLKDYYGKYVWADEYKPEGKTDYELDLMSAETQEGSSRFSYESNGRLWVTTYGTQWTDGVRLFYENNTGYFYPEWDTDKDKSARIYLYEKVETNPLVKVKYQGNSVGGTGMTIYSVSDNSSLNLTSEYRNFPGEVITEWISSDESIATVDQNGFVQFTGEEGEVVITYRVTDKEDSTIKASASVTYTTTIQRDPKRIFKSATEIVPGKKYIVVSTRSIGSSDVMNHDISSNSSRALSYDYHVIQLDNADASLYIEIEEDELQNIFTAASSSVAGYCYLINDETGAYLYGTDCSENNGVLSTGALNNRNVNQYSWKFDEDGLANKNGYGVVYSDSSRYFRMNYRAWETSNVYIFEETELTPIVKIRSNYVAIDGKTVERTQVCAYQTESLVGAPSNFNTSKVNLVWSSDNDEVATVDPATGVLTYTGVSGTVHVNVTAVSTVPDENGTYATATASTTITVIGTEGGETEGARYMLTDKFVPGEIYAFAAYNSAGKHDVMNCWSGFESGDNENILWSNSYEFKKNETTTYFDATDKSIAWECVDAGNGYFYFVNEWTGYLVLYKGNIRATDVTTNLRGRGSYSGVNYDTLNAYQFYQYDNTNHRVSSLHSKANSNYLSLGSSGQFRLSSDPTDMYIYRQCDPSEVTQPVAQIRHDAFGGNKDITNTLLTRNDISNGDTERLLCFHEGFDRVRSITWTSSDPSVATIDENGLITYTGQEGIVTFTMEIAGYKDENPVSIKQMVSMVVSPDPYEAPTEDYPEFPHEGSVRINKTASSTIGSQDFQTTGVAEVELAVTGVPMSKPVDVVIVFDHSSSMNYGGRLESAIEDTRDFALQVVNANEKNRIAIVTFDRYVNQYATYDDKEGTDTSHPSATENRIITGDGTPAGAFVGIDDAEKLVAQIDGLIYNDIEGTNYDEGLEKAYKIVQAAKSDPDANDEQYVIFMSDGESYAYNKLRITYPDNPNEDNIYTAWLKGDESYAGGNGYPSMKTFLGNPSQYPVVQYYHPDGKHWIAEAIKAPEGEDAGLPSASYYNPYRTGLGAEIYSIGYSPDAQGKLTTLTLQNIATTPDHMYSAESNLQEVYDKILNSIIYAANEAVVTDKMGEYFNLQILPSYTIKNGQSTITLDPAPYIEIGSWKLNSDGSRSEEYTEIEKITFEVNSNGVLTAAYSDKVSGNIFNAAQNKIIGKYVSYDFNNEEFSWNIGNITRDEITLKYYAYLEGSAEGEREADLYDTNEYAYLDYNNYLGNDCRQTFPVPTLGWEEAAVNYEFYLVNDLGQPVNSEGMVVPFSERVLVGNPQTKYVHLNTGEDVSASVEAAKVVPEGYILFNEDAAYHVDVSSGDNPSEAVITDKADIVTTYYYEGNYNYNKDGVVPDITDYTYTHVAFGVRLTLSILPDTVVIDYGIPVKIHVSKNDILINTTGEITAISSGVVDGTVLNTGIYKTYMGNGKVALDGETLTLAHGKAYVDGDCIVYEPTDMLMDEETVFYYEVTTKEGNILYSTVTVIPAANMYYEDSFITFNDNGDYKWETAGSTYTDVFQAEDRPGTFTFSEYDANNAYGRDKAYDNNSTTYSLGSAKYTEVDWNSIGSEPTAEFTFCGTGFDFFSCTNSDTGAVLVDVMQNGKSVQKKIVNTYYGYTFGRVYLDENGEVTADESGEPMYLAPEVTEDVYKVGGNLCWTTPTYFEEDGVTLTSEDTGNPAYASGWIVTDGDNGLYQVPVIRIRDLDYGTYDVKITPKYARMFDMKYMDGHESGSYKIYVDAVRIYDPAGVAPETDSKVGKAYIEDEEYIPQYIEIRNRMIDAETFYDSTKLLDDDELTAGVVFIDGISELTKEDIGNIEVSSSYLKAGPNNELYLAKGQAIAFHLVSGRSISPDSLQLGMKTVAGGTSSLFCTNASKDDGTVTLVAGGSEQYRKLSSFVVWDEEALKEGTYQTKYPIIIVNTSDTVVALTTLKWTYSSADDSGELLTMAVSALTPVMAVKALQNSLISEPESVKVDTDSISVSWKTDTIRQGRTAELKVVTPMDITAVTVGGIKLIECKPTGDGNKVWTYRFMVKQIGEFEYDVVLTDSNGNTSEVITTETITVEPPAPDTDSDSGESKLELFFRKLLDMIAEFFAKIIRGWRHE